ncbi:MAG: Protein GrpE [Candidatus Westeberhardia cardiocondylae]|nr:Protein GrpE [Candidatus Westeberhardia cardiocondylae]
MTNNKKKTQETTPNNKNIQNQENTNNKEQETTKITENLQNLQHILELEISLKKEKDNLLRAQAEIENIRRRNEKNLANAHKFALENFITQLLPVIDNLERALQISKKSMENDKLCCDIEGIQLTLKSFLNVVKNFGLKPIDKIHIPFNPEIHQAMTILETNTHEPDQVIMMMQKGYMLHTRLIRPAMVVVSKKPKTSTPQHKTTKNKKISNIHNTKNKKLIK